MSDHADELGPLADHALAMCNRLLSWHDLKQIQHVRDFHQKSFWRIYANHFDPSTGRMDFQVFALYNAKTSELIEQAVAAVVLYEIAVQQGIAQATLTKLSWA